MKLKECTPEAEQMLWFHDGQSSKQPKRPDCHLLTSLLDMLVEHLQQAHNAEWPCCISAGCCYAVLLLGQGTLPGGRRVVEGNSQSKFEQACVPLHDALRAAVGQLGSSRRLQHHCMLACRNAQKMPTCDHELAVPVVIPPVVSRSARAKQD